LNCGLQPAASQPANEKKFKSAVSYQPAFESGLISLLAGYGHLPSPTFFTFFAANMVYHLTTVHQRRQEVFDMKTWAT